MFRDKLTLISLLTLAALLHTSLGQYGERDFPAINRREEHAIRAAKAKEVLKYMNTDADPCSDFFDFACGNWSQHKPEPEGEEIVSVQSLLEQSIMKDLQIILNEPRNSQDTLSTSKVKEFYKDCFVEKSTSERQQSFFMSVIKRNEGIPLIAGTNWNINYNWLRVIAMLRANYGMEILIGLDIDMNLHTMRGNSIYLGEPKTTLIPAELCNARATEDMDVKNEAFEETIKTADENMQRWFSLTEGEARRYALEVVRFEFDLCRQMRNEAVVEDSSDVEEANEPRHRYRHRRAGMERVLGNRKDSKFPRKHLQQLNQQYGNVINFKQFVDTVFDNHINDPVYVRSAHYFRQLVQTIKLHEKSTLAIYIMYRALASLSFPAEADQPDVRLKYCVELVTRNFPKFIGEMYNHKFQRSDARSDVETIFMQIRAAFEKSLNVEWLDKNAKNAAGQKLAQFKFKFPVYQNLNLDDLRLERANNYWNKLEMIMKYNAKQDLSRLYNSEVDSRLYSVEAPDVRMQLVPPDNEIITGWGLLQQPLYHYAYSKSLKYSLLGQRMARELVMAFDEEGWVSNPIMRMDEYTAEAFHNHTECFREQFSNYLYNSPENYRNTSKVRELVADSAGLGIAFQAYLDWLDSIESSNRQTLLRETLPEVNFTNTQLFFINFAQTRCAVKHVEKEPPQFLPLDWHTFERYNVNGPLANNAEFAREFGCSTGTEMNAADKCVIY